MHSPTQVIRFLVVCSISHTIVVYSDVKTSCSVDQYNTITCTFSENINQTKRQFLVQKYRLNSTSSAVDRVLDCLWPARSPEKTDCITSPGYVFNGNVSTTLQLHIPKPGSEFSGRYECQAIPSRPGDLSSCDLIVTDLPTETTLSNLTGTTTASTSAVPHTSSCAPVVDCDGFPAHLAFLLIFAFLLFVVTLFTVAIFVYTASFRITCRPTLRIYKLPIEQAGRNVQEAGTSQTCKTSDMSTQVSSCHLSLTETSQKCKTSDMATQVSSSHLSLTETSQTCKTSDMSTQVSSSHLSLTDTSQTCKTSDMST